MSRRNCWKREEEITQEESPVYDDDGDKRKTTMKSSLTREIRLCLRAPLQDVDVLWESQDSGGISRTWLRNPFDPLARAGISSSGISE